MLRAAAALAALERAAAWWSTGTLPTDSDFAVYVGKFCFDCQPRVNRSDPEPPAAGTFDATVHGHVRDRPRKNQTEDDTIGRLYLLVFSDEKDHWMRARPFWDELTCKERIELASWATPISQLLTTEPFAGNWSVVVRQSTRPRFWYFAFLNCGAEIVEPVEFKVHALNVQQGFQAEFSLDLRGSVFLESAFTGLFALVVLVAGCAGFSRRGRGEGTPRSSPLLRLLCTSASCSMAGSCLRALHHLAFAVNGHGIILLAVVGALLACVAKALLLILHFVVAKGWALLYQQDDWPKRYTILAGLCGVVFLSVGCEIWEQYFHDQSTAFYHYESWPGRSILAMNACLMAASLAYMRGTYRREEYGEVRTFYVLVTVACGIYFVAIPVVCLLAELLDPWVRRKIVERVEISTRFAATALLTLCLRPSRLDSLISARLKNGDQPQLLADKHAQEETELS